MTWNKSQNNFPNTVNKSIENSYEVVIIVLVVIETKTCNKGISNQLKNSAVCQASISFVQSYSSTVHLSCFAGNEKN